MTTRVVTVGLGIAGEQRAEGGASDQLRVSRRQSDLIRSLASAMLRGPHSTLEAVIAIGVRRVADELAPEEAAMFALERDVRR